MGKIETYDQYDGNGNLQQFTDRKGQITKYVYDALNRRTFAGYGYNAGTNSYESTITYGYDAGNRLRTVTDSVAGLITLTPDDLDCLTSEVNPQGTVSFHCDAAGRRQDMTVAGQTQVTYNYDDANRLTTMTQGSTSVGFGYDLAGRRGSTTYSSGVSVQYGYDPASRLSSMTYKNGSTVLGNLMYTYDPAGHRTKLGGSWARVTIPQAVSSATYNDANQLATWNGIGLAYDDNGNVIYGGSNAYNWNARNQLVNVGLSASFVYDGLGRRVKKTVGGVPTQFLYDGLNPVQEISATGTANLITGLGIDEYFTRTDSIGSSNFVTDALGSTVALLDGAGAVQTQYTYEPFGKMTFTGQTNSNSFQYTGRENDGTGLAYYRARYYSPTFQRFVSEDPIGFLGGDFNLYGYVLNSPIRHIDPYGLDVIIAYYPNMANGLGHVGIGVNTYSTVGLYPLNSDWLTSIKILESINVPGVIHPDAYTAGSHTQYKTLKTTPQQDTAIQAAIDAANKNPGNYTSQSHS